MIFFAQNTLKKENIKRQIEKILVILIKGHSLISGIKQNAFKSIKNRVMAQSKSGKRYELTLSRKKKGC